LREIVAGRGTPSVAMKTVRNELIPNEL
jgi:hypothetical protein